MHDANRKRHPYWKAIELGIKSGIVLAVLLVQFRLLTICLAVIFGITFLLAPRLRLKRWMIPATVVIVISMLLPFDVALGNFHYGTRRGTSKGGPHLVLFVVGMPMHTKLIKEYGEYVSGGCAWPALYPPGWIFVWN
jgi:hypothetical protein